VSLDQIWLQRESLSGILFRAAQVPPSGPVHGITISQSGIGERKTGILTQGLLEVTDCLRTLRESFRSKDNDHGDKHRRPAD